MQATLEILSEKMRSETEDFLSEEMRSSSDPREAYEVLLRELRSANDATPPTQTPPLRRRPAA